MLNKVLKFIFDLNKTTALLEACEWDEERYDYILASLVGTFNDVTTGYHEFQTPAVLIEEIKNKMSNISSESELEVISNILLEEIGNIDYQEIKYEN